MLLYDVTYPHSCDLDSRVPWSYLRRLAAKSPRPVGALATCINGEADCYRLDSDGEWREVTAAKTQAR